MAEIVYFYFFQLHSKQEWFWLFAKRDAIKCISKYIKCEHKRIFMYNLANKSLPGEKKP